MPTVGSVRRVTRNWSSIIRLADPDFEKDKKRELVYEFTNGKTTVKKYQDPDRSGPYSDES